MTQSVIAMLLTKKYIIQWIGFFVFFMGIYTLLDSFNMSYAAMQMRFGTFTVVLHISLNVVMAALVSLLLNMSAANAALKTGKETKGSNLGFFSVMFGALTYGCTPCVIGFFASLGIAFSVAVLPLAGLPYKLISLVLIIGGLIWTHYEIERSTCPLPKI